MTKVSQMNTFTHIQNEESKAMQYAATILRLHKNAYAITEFNVDFTDLSNICIT